MTMIVRIYESVSFRTSVNSRNGMSEITLTDENNNTLSKLTYTLSPITTFTANKNPDDFINVEMLETPEKYRKQGYASLLLKKLVEMYPDKKIIGRTNDLSKGIFSKYQYKEN